MSTFFQIFSVTNRNFRKNCKLTLYTNRFPVIYIVNTLIGGRDVSVRIVTRLLAGQYGNRGWMPTREMSY